MIDRKIFADFVREHLFHGKMTQPQWDGIDTLLRTWERRGHGDLRKCAYLLATVFHETARTMQPVKEYGRGRGHPYGKPDHETGCVYYGRGYVQLTWKDNYKKMSKVCEVDLVSDPDLACQPDIAAIIAFEGMWKGLFTGVSQHDFFTDKKSDPVHARRIINGLDRADLIAGYFHTFLDALKTAQVE
jgi:predicted chitinase